MTPTEIFKLFLKNGVTPNERLAFTTVIRNDLYISRNRRRRRLLWRKDYWDYDVEVDIQILVHSFAERIMLNSHQVHNNFGSYGTSSSCTYLSSFMKYLLFYMPKIVGTARQKNRFLSKEVVEIPENIGYKRYWESRLIKKWHNFLKENVVGYDTYFVARNVNSYNHWRLKS